MAGFFKRLFDKPLQSLSSSGRTNTGRVRNHNEDSFCILADRNLFAVADGMGGHNAGEVASRAAIQALDALFSKEALRIIKGNKEEIRHFLIKGFHHINNLVMEMARDTTTRHGMGCTLVSCLVDDGFLHTCHVGDSRCYMADEQRIEQLTTDHSMMAAYAEKSEYGAAPDLKRPPRQVITKAIGFPFSEDPEYHCQEIWPDSRLLLCSDGLWSMVSDEQIHDVLVTAEATDEASNLLVQKANEAGGTDNITAVVIFC